MFVWEQWILAVRVASLIAVGSSIVSLILYAHGMGRRLSKAGLTVVVSLGVILSIMTGTIAIAPLTEVRSWVPILILAGSVLLTPMSIVFNRNLRSLLREHDKLSQENDLLREDVLRLEAAVSKDDMTISEIVLKIRRFIDAVDGRRSPPPKDPSSTTTGGGAEPSQVT